MVEAIFAVDERLGDTLLTGGWNVRRANVGWHTVVAVNVVLESFETVGTRIHFGVPVDNIHPVAEVRCNLFGLGKAFYEDMTC